MDPKGWFSRGYLPHLDSVGVVQLVTFRLADSLPESALRRMEDDISQVPEGERERERRRRLDRFLDAGHGACWLRQPAVAAIVEGTLLRSGGRECRLIAWTIMPNHVHVLCQALPGSSLPGLVKR